MQIAFTMQINLRTELKFLFCQYYSVIRVEMYEDYFFYSDTLTLNDILNLKNLKMDSLRMCSNYTIFSFNVTLISVHIVTILLFLISWNGFFFLDVCVTTALFPPLPTQ